MIEGIRGTINADPVASFQCSGAAPCRDISMLGVELDLVNGKWRVGGSVAIWWGQWGSIVRERRVREGVLLMSVRRRRGPSRELCIT